MESTVVHLKPATQPAIAERQSALLRAVLPEDQAAKLARELLAAPEQERAEKAFTQILKAYILNEGDWLQRGKPFRYGGVCNLVFTISKVLSTLGEETGCEDYLEAAKLIGALEAQVDFKYGAE